MLSTKLLNQFRTIAKSIGTMQQRFVDLYSAALIEVAGKHWQRGDIAAFFETVQGELIVALVDSELMAQSVFYAYCHAARTALLFDVPFSIANRVTTKDLPEVKRLVEADKTRDPKPTKFIRAANKVREDRKAEILASTGGGNASLPMPFANEAPEVYAYRVCRMLATLGESEEVQEHSSEDLTDLLAIAKGVVASFEAKQARKKVARIMRTKRSLKKAS